MLYGSVARVDQGAKSDVDVLVKVSNLSEKDLIEETASKQGISLTPIIVEEGKEKTSFLETVEEEGKKYIRG